MTAAGARVGRAAAAEGAARLLVLGAAVLWGTTGTSQALGPDGATPLAVGTVRLVLGGAVLVALAVRGAEPRGPGGPGGLRRAGAVRGGGVGALAVAPGRGLGAALTSAVCVAAYQLTFFAAVARTGVALGTVVAIGSAPAVTGVLGRLVRGERPERGWATATALAVAGSALLLLGGGGDGAVDVVGLLLALAAGGSYAGYTLASKVLLDSGRDSTAVMALGFGGGAVLVAPLLAVVDLGWVGTPSGLAVALWLALVTMAVSYVLFGRGLAVLPASTVTTLSLAEPLTAALLGVLLLGERPGVVGLVGGGLVLGGLLVLAVPARRGRAVPAGS